MNLIPEIAKRLGLEIGEEFELCEDLDNNNLLENRYMFSNKSLICKYEDGWRVASDKTLRNIIEGYLKIVKLPFEPKEGEKYYFVSVKDSLTINEDIWRGTTKDYMCKYCGNCFRTIAEAEAHKYEIYEKLVGKKWEE